MKRKSTDYKSAGSGGWIHASTDLFLARYRGQPCEICGASRGFQDGKQVRSNGHHLIHQSKSRSFKFEPKNIVVLCPKHHGIFEDEISPHSVVSDLAVIRFGEWLETHNPDQYEWWRDNENNHPPFTKARLMYEELGGEISGKEEGLPMKAWKPKNHAKNVILTIYRNGGVLTLAEKKKLDRWVSRR